MFGFEIFQFLCKSIKSEHICITSIDSLPKSVNYPSYFVINLLPIHVNDIGHWVAIHFSKDQHCTFFDSLNLPMHQNVAAFIKKFAKKFNRNNTQLQQETNDSCGHHVCVFLYFMSIDFSLEYFLKMFSHNYFLNDHLISTLFQDLNK
jgi:hypothetical protein